MKLQKALAVFGAGVILFAASDGITYAATGSSLLMGRINQATSATTIQNTSTGSALRLITQATTTPPMIVNGKGKVVNLYADRVATADNATKLGGKTAAQVAASAPRPAGLITVAKSGGQFTSVKAALASITDSGPSHPYVIKVAPGTYVETSPIVVKTFVDIEGSGRNRTTLFCGCHGLPAASADHATVSVTTAVDAEIRDLTITNNHSEAGNAVAVYVGSPTPAFSLDHVTLTALSTAGNGIGLYVNNGAAGPHLDDLNVYVVGSGGSSTGIFLKAPTIVRNSWVYTSGQSVFAYTGNSWLVASTVVGDTIGLTGRCSVVMTTDGAPYTCA